MCPIPSDVILSPMPMANSILGTVVKVFLTLVPGALF